MYKLAETGVFWTINGEATHLGQPMCFVRFAGCSVGCRRCDTNYLETHTLSQRDLVRKIDKVLPSEFQATRPWVWLTGGEPTDQDIQPLITKLTESGYRVALAESGHNQRRLEGLSWRSVSPHRRIENLYGSEVKLVPNLGGLTWDDMHTAKLWARHFSRRWVQPLAGDPLELTLCLDFVQSEPGYQLSIQAHNAWRIP